MPAAQRSRRSAHRRRIESIPAVMTVTPHEDVGHLGIVDCVAIQFPPGVPVSVKRLRHILGRTDHNILGQMRVDGLDEDVGGNTGFEKAVDHLAHGMHTSVGAPLALARMR